MADKEILTHKSREIKQHPDRKNLCLLVYLYVCRFIVFQQFFFKFKWPLGIKSIYELDDK